MKRALVGAMLALGLAGSTTARAFCRTKTCGKNCTFDLATACPVEGRPVAWTGSCQSYSVYRYGSPSISHEQLTVVTDLAFRAWREASCPGINKPPSIAVRDEFGAATCGRVEYNAGQANANIVVIRDTWDGDKNVLALTTITTNKETGEIYDADMEINGTQPLSVGGVVLGRYDLQSVVTHEAGHFLGLAHSNQAAATMYATYMAGTDAPATLDADDIAGICSIYPPDRLAPVCDPTPRRGFSPECALDPASGGACSLAVARRGSSSALSAIVLAFGAAAARLRRGGVVKSSRKGRDLPTNTSRARAPARRRAPRGVADERP